MPCLPLHCWVGRATALFVAAAGKCEGPIAKLQPSLPGALQTRVRLRYALLPWLTGLRTDMPGMHPGGSERCRAGQGRAGGWVRDAATIPSGCVANPDAAALRPPAMTHRPPHRHARHACTLLEAARGAGQGRGGWAGQHIDANQGCHTRLHCMGHARQPELEAEMLQRSSSSQHHWALPSTRSALHARAMVPTHQIDTARLASSRCQRER